MSAADDILFEPVKDPTIKKPDVLKAVCASCHKIFEKPSISGEIYCKECRHQNWSASNSGCAAGDGCCGGGYC